MARAFPMTERACESITQQSPTDATTSDVDPTPLADERGLRPMNRTNTLRHLRHPAAGILAVLVAGAVGSVATSCGRASAEVSQTEALPAYHADP